MKTTKLTIFVVIALLCLGACKKDEQAAKAKSPAELIIGKWALVSYARTQTFTDKTKSPTVETHTGLSTDYFDFMSGGKLKINVNKEETNETYTLSADGKILTVTGDPSVTIKTLDATSLIYTGTSSEPEWTSEYTVILKRL